MCDKTGKLKENCKHYKENMAAIDKLYLKDYYQFNQLRTWALIYYPKLLRYFSDYAITEEDFDRWREWWVNAHMEQAETDYRKFCEPFADKEQMIANYISQTKVESCGYECSFEDAKIFIDSICNRYEASEESWIEEYSISVMNTSFRVDRKLKWICPLPFIRDYLHEQCGVNPKWEWFYKLFWRGKSLWK